MANPEITNNDSSKLELFDPIYENVTLEVLGADTLVENTVLAYDAAGDGGDGSYKATVSTVAATATARAILKD